MIRAVSHIRKNAKWYFLLGLILVSIVLWAIVVRENREGVLTFSVLNIGQGDSILVESPTGVQVLIDAGPNRGVMKELSAVLSWYDRHIDMIVATHADKDHFEGFIPFFDKYKTEVVLLSGTESSSDTYKVFKEKIQKNNLPVVLARRGQVVDIGGGAYLEVLFPDRDVSGMETNDASVVLKLVYGETSAILQGDSPVKIEEYLISLDKAGLNSDILKTGHHGSRTSTGEEYVKAVSPKWAIITAGKDNSYGHPHSEVVDILNKLKVEILGTHVLGRIVFESDGKDFIQK